MTADDYIRFDSFVVKSLTGCWYWLGGDTPAGYGRFWLNGKTVSPHRIQYERYHGAIPEGMWVLHTCHCGHKGCVNPYHLELGSPKENAQHKLNGPKHNSGTQAFNSRFSEQDIADIRASSKSRSALAREYGTCPSHISKIVLHKYY